jgi:hypothetical protein
MSENRLSGAEQDRRIAAMRKASEPGGELAPEILAVMRGLSSLGVAEDALANGALDFVAVGRQRDALRKAAQAVALTERSRELSAAGEVPAPSHADVARATSPRAGNPRAARWQ